MYISWIIIWHFCLCKKLLCLLCVALKTIKILLFMTHCHGLFSMRMPNIMCGVRLLITTFDCFIWQNTILCLYLCAGPEFSEHGFYHRMFLVMLFCFLQRQKYYFAWKLGKLIKVRIMYYGSNVLSLTLWTLLPWPIIIKIVFTWFQTVFKWLILVCPKTFTA